MKIFLFLLFILGVSSCSKKLSEKRYYKFDEERIKKNIPTGPHVYSNDSNSISDGRQTSTSFILPIYFKNILTMEGREIDYHIRYRKTNVTNCLVARYPDATIKKLLVISATPAYTNNFGNNTQKWFYILKPADEEKNKADCETAGMLSSLETEYPGEKISFSLETFCSSCASNFFYSKTLQFYYTSGEKNQAIKTNYLSLNISLHRPIGENIGSSCKGNQDCTAKGFDCCLAGLCVKDKTPRLNVDQTSQDFLQALNDIFLKESSIKSYPNYFYLCIEEIDRRPSFEEDPNHPDFRERYDDDLDPDHQEEANEDYTNMKALYECTVPQYAQASYCRIDFPVAKESNTYPNFYTGEDDRNFTSTYSGTKTIPTNSVIRIEHAGQVLFENNAYNPQEIQFGPPNDNLTDPTLITLNHNPPEEAIRYNLLITYQIDGSCEKINPGLARCYVDYVQGQDKGKIDDHYPATNEFVLPFYADPKKDFFVTVNGIQKIAYLHWKPVETGPPKIIFMGENLHVNDTERVRIQFFVDTSLHQVMNFKQKALDQIRVMCNCGENPCYLKPVYDIHDFEENDPIQFLCSYSKPDENAQKTISVFLDSKTAPHRYYDKNGVWQETVNVETPDQEGILFEYKGKDFLKPNNVDEYIGFNEIYGSFTLSANSAQPALSVTLESNKTYDIFVDNGIFSTCPFCGRDYYNNIIGLFPNNFTYQGGGYQPDWIETDRFQTDPYRSDDLIFGRACWLPTTMIPWTHRPKASTQDQRLSRLASQHFLFANGYQRDWFGFDYGSVIGSFDGISWFSIGNQRRVKSTSNKLFLAVNAYYSDLTPANNFTVTISDASAIPYSGSAVKTDFYSTGAECQQFHLCESDIDCIGQLGYEYVCESITNITSNWPVVDINATEMPNENKNVRLLNIINGALVGGSKRCVYRGKGAPCLPNYGRQDIDNIFNNSATPGLLGCASNFYCQPFEMGVLQNLFNNKIARFGRSVNAQNISDNLVSPENTFGRSARIIGRPYDYNGKGPINSQAQSNLSFNLVNSICIPGRDPALETTYVVEQNATVPHSDFDGDKVLGIGMTLKGNKSKEHYYSSCSIIDGNGDYYHFRPENLQQTLGNSTLKTFSGAQAISTNSVALIQSLSEIPVVKDFKNEQIISPALQYNRCLRAAGFPCHTDLDCAPNNLIASSAAGIDSEDIDRNGKFINRYEVLFWQEELICSQLQLKKRANPNYFLKNNRCCRPTNENLTIGTLINQEGISKPDNSYPIFDNRGVPGIDIDLDDPRRYTRNTIVYPLFNNPDTTARFPPLYAAGKDKCETGTCVKSEEVRLQFNTFSTIASKTCCTGHWVRNFHSEDNGGGHIWGPLKLQTIKKEGFRCINWRKCTPNRDCNSPKFSCSESESPNDPTCLARSLSVAEYEPYMKWLGTLELTGIPQITVKTKDSEDIHCIVDPLDQALSGQNVPPDIIKDVTNTNAEYSIDGTPSSTKFFSALDRDNFQDSVKLVFSSDTITCCLPNGSPVNENDEPNVCCSGMINSATQKCALADYTDLSVYFNRYVSSEGEYLTENFFDPETGYINAPNHLEEVACSTLACASNKIARGVAVSNLKITGHHDSEVNVRRFVTENNSKSTPNNEVAKLYDAGLKWNNHVYCVPQNLQTNAGIGLIVIDCSTFTGVVK